MLDKDPVGARGVIESSGLGEDEKGVFVADSYQLEGRYGEAVEMYGKWGPGTPWGRNNWGVASYKMHLPKMPPQELLKPISELFAEAYSLETKGESIHSLADIDISLTSPKIHSLSQLAILTNFCEFQLATTPPKHLQNIGKTLVYGLKAHEMAQ